METNLFLYRLIKMAMTKASREKVGLLNRLQLIQGAKHLQGGGGLANSSQCK